MIRKKIHKTLEIEGVVEMKKKFFPHQQEAYDRIISTLKTGKYANLSLPGFLFYDDMGLGKTLVAVHVLLSMKNSFPSLVIAKKALLDNFKKELQQVANTLEINKKFKVNDLSNFIQDLPRSNFLGLFDLDFVLESKEMLPLNGSCVVFCPLSKLSRLMSCFAYNMNEQSFFQDSWCCSRYFLVNNRHSEINSLNFIRFRSAMIKGVKGEPSVERVEQSQRFFGQKWGFLVADEAQNFKSPDSLQTRAAMFIRSDYRLALTGTPSMNNGSEMCNIVRYFLQYDARYPWSDNSSSFYKKICFGRKESDVKDSLNLPPCHHYDVRVSMEGHPIDEKIYKRQLNSLGVCAENIDSLMLPDETREEFRNRMQDSRRAFFTASDALSRCCMHHRFYTSKFLKSKDAKALDEEEKHSLVDDETNLIFSTPWSQKTHLFYPFWFQARVLELMCSLKFTKVAFFPKDIRLMIVQYVAEAEKKMIPLSPKLDAVFAIFKEMEQRNIENNDSDKLVVMSRSLVFLDEIVRPFFEERGIGVCVLSGKLKKVEDKLAAIHQFKNDDGKKILCATVQVAGEGLNFQDVSSTLVLTEPGWNVKNDRQAVKRVYRIGQKRETRIYRLIVSGSVDEAFLSMQRAKEMVCNSATSFSGFFKVAKTLKSAIDFDLTTALKPKPGDAPYSFVKGMFLHDKLVPSSIFDNPTLDDEAKNAFNIFEDRENQSNDDQSNDMESEPEENPQETECMCLSDTMEPELKRLKK